MGKIGLGGALILAFIFLFILVPWHKANDPKPVNGEEKSILTTWWELGQPTRPTKATEVAQPSTAPSATTSVATSTPVSTGKTVTSNVKPKAQGPKKNPTPKATKQSQPQTQTEHVDMAKAMESAFQ